MNSTGISTVLSARGNTHGEFGEQCYHAQALKAVISRASSRLTARHKEALEMIAVKISRIMAGDPDYKDHWVDIAGYASRVAERCTS